MLIIYEAGLGETNSNFPILNMHLTGSIFVPYDKPL
jgi:hypothetical protein